MSYYVYTYSNPSRLDRHGQAQRFYVGKGSGNRISKQHRSSRGPYCARYLAKMGCKPILEKFDCESEAEAFDLEKFLIAEIGRDNMGLGPLTNLTDGGDGVSGRRNTPETIAKMSASATGRKASPEERARLTFLARNRTPDTLAKMSAAHKGKSIPLEIRARMSAASRASPLVAAHMSKVGASWRGKTRPLATRLKMAASSILREARKAGKEVPAPRTPEYIAMRDALILKLSGT